MTNRVVGSHWRDITDLVWSGEPVCGCSLSIIWYCFIISPSCPVIRGDGETTALITGPDCVTVLVRIAVRRISDFEIRNYV